jgi:hypothetical protein
MIVDHWLNPLRKRLVSKVSVEDKRIDRIDDTSVECCCRCILLEEK